jgi:hypothetical protein
MTLKEYYNDILSKSYNGWDDQYKFIINNLENSIPFSYARFNDGEMMGINKIGSVVARGDQMVDKSLHNALRTAIQHKQHNYYVGIPCQTCFPLYHKIANDLIGEYDQTVSAVALTNRNWAKFMSELPRVMVGKKVHYISGDDQNIEPLKDIFNMNILTHTKLPSRNSWNEYDTVSKYIDHVVDGDVVIISLGPTARVLCKEWFELKPNTTFIDIGSILDPFTRNVWHNCHKGWENGFNLTKKCKSCN